MDIQGSSTKSKRKLGFSTIILSIIVIVLAISMAYLYKTNRDLHKQIEETQYSTDKQTDEAEIERIVGLVAQHMILPDETPVIYIISNPQEAIDAYGSFFDNSVDGDYLIIYSDKAIIYRETEDIVINSGPVFFIEEGFESTDESSVIEDSDSDNEN